MVAATPSFADVRSRRRRRAAARGAAASSIGNADATAGSSRVGGYVITHEEPSAAVPIGDAEARSMFKAARITFRVLVYGLAVVGLAELAAQAFNSFASGALPSDATVVQRSESPNKQYQVILFNRNGGPSSPFCVEKVTVSPVGTSDQSAYDDYSVAVTGCGGITSINWRGQRKVDVGLDIAKGNANNDTSLKGSSRDERIAIEYSL